MSNFAQIGCYLLFDQLTHLLYIILDHKNLKFKYLIDDITIDIWSSWKFACMNNIIRTCNLTIIFSKFTYNKTIKEKFGRFFSKLVWRETFSEAPFSNTKIFTNLQ